MMPGITTYNNRLNAIPVPFIRAAGAEQARPLALIAGNCAKPHVTMTPLLLLETSGPRCSVAISQQEQVISLRESDEKNKHAELITVFIGELLNETGLSMNDIKAVALSNGPGSYTGLRIGASVAKGICFATGIPIMEISSLEVLAYGARQKTQAAAAEKYYALRDAGRMEVYAQVFDYRLHPCCAPFSFVFSDPLNDREVFSPPGYFFGSGAEKVRDILASAGLQYIGGIEPSAAAMAIPAFNKFKHGQFSDAETFEPVYLKEARVGKNQA